MTTVHIDAHEVHDLADDLRRNAATAPDKVELAVEKTGHDMQATAMVLVPKDTTFLEHSISLDFHAGRGAGGRFHSGMGFELGPTAEYGEAIELGVPHPVTIHARDGGFLRFMVGGREVFVRSVTIPPRPPQPYLGPAFDAHLPDLEQALGAIGAQAVDRG